MRRATLVLALPLLVGCALTSKSTPEDIRYFSPELDPAPAAQASADAPRARVRFARLTSSTNLRRRIVHRESRVETDEYETLRWTENPEEYVRRSLESALLERRVEQAMGGNAPALDVEVVGFEAIAQGARRGGRVEIRYRLRDESSVLASGDVTVERDAAGTDFDGIVIAIGTAMDAATAQVATAVASRVRR